jgi:hypothetical protein
VNAYLWEKTAAEMDEFLLHADEIPDTCVAFYAE